MGFWKKFGKIALATAPFVAAPFTGGASLIPTLARAGIGATTTGGGWKSRLLGAGIGAATGGAGGSLVKGGVKTGLTQGLKRAALSEGLRTGLKTAGIGAATAGAISKGRAQAREAENALNLAREPQRLAAANYNLALPSNRAGAAVEGDLLAGIQDYKLTGRGRDVQSTGGLRPSLLTPGTRQIGSDIARKALLSQMGQVPKGQEDPYASYTPVPVTRPGTLDTVLSGAGIASDVLESLPLEDLLAKFGKKPVPASAVEGEDIYAGLE